MFNKSKSLKIAENKHNIEVQMERDFNAVEMDFHSSWFSRLKRLYWRSSTRATSLFENMKHFHFEWNFIQKKISIEIRTLNWEKKSFIKVIILRKTIRSPVFENYNGAITSWTEKLHNYHLDNIAQCTRAMNFFEHFFVQRISIHCSNFFSRSE